MITPNKEYKVLSISDTTAEYGQRGQEKPLKNMGRSCFT
jgi:hypothetical protein